MNEAVLRMPTFVVQYEVRPRCEACVNRQIGSQRVGPRREDGPPSLPFTPAQLDRRAGIGLVLADDEHQRAGGAWREADVDDGQAEGAAGEADVPRTAGRAGHAAGHQVAGGRGQRRAVQQAGHRRRQARHRTGNCATTPQQTARKVEYNSEATQGTRRVRDEQIEMCKITHGVVAAILGHGWP